MKHLFLLLIGLILLNPLVHAQTISISQSSEICPGNDYTFAVTSLPHPYKSVEASGGATVWGDYEAGGVLYFTGRFADLNQTQSFTVNWNGGTSTTFDYKRILSLTIPTIQSCAVVSGTVTAPLCQTTDIPFSFSARNFANPGEGICLTNTISSYEYLIPAGWQLNGVLSNGSTWQSGSNSVTLTPDATTGGVVQVRAINGCSSTITLSKSQIFNIPIVRATPTFTLSPMSQGISCGTSVTQTYTVSMSAPAPACTVSYRWDLGSNNGWKMGGVAAPTTPFSGSSSITLESLATNNHYGNVSVTPIINGVDQPTITSVTSFIAPNFGLIGGSNSICTGTSSSFSVYPMPGYISSIYWGLNSILPNYGATVVSVDNQYASSTTLTKINSGVVDLSVSLTDACSQTYSRTRSGINVGGYSSAYALSGYTLAYPPCPTPLCTPSAVYNSISSSGPYGTTVYSGIAYMNTSNQLYIYNSELTSGTWSLVSGNPASWSSYNGNNLTVTPGDYDPIKFRLTASNSCGTLYYDFTFYTSNYTYLMYDGGESEYRLSPNPAQDVLAVAVNTEKTKEKSVAVNSEKSKDKKLAGLSVGSDIKEIHILDKMGNLKQKQTFVQGSKKININVSKLKADVYVIRIFNGKEWKTMQFIKR